MLKEIFVYVSVVAVLSGCDFQKKETAQLKSTVDSLRTQLATNTETQETLREISVLIDSIDASRHVLRTRMVEGTSLQDFTSRMTEIHKYVKETENRIAFLEKRIHSANNSNSSYTGAVKKLRHDLELRNQELAALQEQVSKYRNESENLLQTVNLQKAEIADKLSQLDLKLQEVAKLEANVNELRAQAKIDEADAYFLRAQALEETANRTKFAPRKKKNTRKEALELYKLAASLGKDEAQVKASELEKKI